MPPPRRGTPSPSDFCLGAPRIPHMRGDLGLVVGAWQCPCSRCIHVSASLLPGQHTRRLPGGSLPQWGTRETAQGAHPTLLFPDVLAASEGTSRVCVSPSRAAQASPTPLSLQSRLLRAISADRLMIIVTLMSSQVAGAFPLGACLPHTSPSPESLLREVSIPISLEAGRHSSPAVKHVQAGSKASARPVAGD